MAQVLIVDDDSNFRSLLSSQIQQLGHQTLIAANGREALDLVEENPDIDLIILDIMMPQLDGNSFLSQMNSQAPVIVLTESRQCTFQNHVVACLYKQQTNFEQILTYVKKYTQNQQQPTPPQS